MTDQDVEVLRGIIQDLRAKDYGVTIFQLRRGGLTEGRVRRYLSQLHKLGLVSKKRNGRFVFWVWDPDQKVQAVPASTNNELWRKEYGD